MQNKASPEEKLDNMASDATNLASENAFMSPGTTRRRGRPKGSKNRVEPGLGSNGNPTEGNPKPGSGVGAPPQVDPIAELMPLTNGLASFYSNMLVQLAEDERARLTEDKHKVVAHTSAVCLNQYFPGVLGMHAAAIVLGVTVLETSMTAIRLRKENLEKLRREYQQRQQANSGSNQANSYAQ